jgi:hypothetical protein
MASNRPAGQSWETYLEFQLRRAREEGQFDNLPGAGKPIPNLDQHYDENWWLREWMRRENLSALPDTLRLRKELSDEIERLWRIPSESQAAETIDAINARIRRLNSTPLDGPPLNLSVLNKAETLERWREERDARV